MYQSTNSSISTSDTEIGRDPNSSLGSGRSRTITVTSRLSNQASGTFYFGLCMVAVSGESNTQNNCSRGVRVAVRSSGGPDLVVLSRSTVTVSPGGTFSYDVTVRNEGNGSSPATRLRTYQSDNSTITTSDTEIGQGATVPALDPSGTARGTHTISIPAGFSTGTIYIGDCVDAVSGETNTNNNCSSAITVIVQPGGGGGTTYATGQTITTLPTGSWVPNQLGGGTTFQSSGGTVTITFSGTSSYMIYNSIRYSCLDSNGCQIVNRRVTRGSIRASNVSSNSLAAAPQQNNRTLQLTGKTGLEVHDEAETGRSPDSASGQVHSATIAVAKRNDGD